MGYLGFARLWWGEQQRGVNEPPHCKAARTSYTLQRRHFLRVCTTYFPIEYIAVKVGLCGDSFIIIPVVDTATSHDAGFRHDEPPCTSCVNITSADYTAAERRKDVLVGTCISKGGYNGHHTHPEFKMWGVLFAQAKH